MPHFPLTLHYFPHRPCRRPAVLVLWSPSSEHRLRLWALLGPVLCLTPLNSIWLLVGIQYIFVKEVKCILSLRPSPGGQLMPLGECQVPWASLDIPRRQGTRRTTQKHLGFFRDHPQVPGCPLRAPPESHADLRHSSTNLPWDG